MLFGPELHGRQIPPMSNKCSFDQGEMYYLKQLACYLDIEDLIKLGLYPQPLKSLWLNIVQ